MKSVEVSDQAYTCGEDATEQKALEGLNILYPMGICRTLWRDHIKSII
jgi:cytochrome c5